MLPLTVEDLLPLDEFATRRREFFDSHRRYVDRFRRVRVGPKLTLVFENRKTLWYRVQEIIRIARLIQPHEVQQELDLYNRLLPGENRLQAALLIEIADQGQLTRELSAWQSLTGDQLCLNLGSERFPATLVTCRPEDRCIGTAHWIQFTLDVRARRLISDHERPAYFVFDNGAYQHRTGLLSEDLRRSLLEDLEMTEPDRRAS